MNRFQLKSELLQRFESEPIVVAYSLKRSVIDQLHKRYTVEQIQVVLQGYCQGTISRAEVEEMWPINKTRFFALLKDYRSNPETFSITYQRETPAKLTARVEAAIEQELLREKELVDNPQLPITSYNYSALRDRLKKKGIAVSATTITARAKQLDCYKPHPKGKAHTREVVTAAIGALVQHDASFHLWSPYASEKWTLITSIDDYSRQLLFAETRFWKRLEPRKARSKRAQSYIKSRTGHIHAK